MVNVLFDPFVAPEIDNSVIDGLVPLVPLVPAVPVLPT